MAVIAIISYFEIGHLIPSLSFGAELREDGNEIIFLVIEDMVEFVQDAGFSSVIIFPETYPPGTLKELDEMRQLGQNPEIKPHIIPLLNGAIDHVFNEIKPDLLLIDYTLAFEALIIHYRYSIKQVFFSTMLPEETKTPKAICVWFLMNLKGEVSAAVLEFILKKHHLVGLTKLDDILSPIVNMIELILCPKEFEIPGKEYYNQRVYHTGPCVSGIIKECDSDFAVPSSKKSIFVSFGSQSSLYSEKFKKVIIKLFSIMQLPSLSNFHLTVALGDAIKEEDFVNIPPNVTMMKWVRQHKIIERSSLVITHGGLGAIKECLYFGVPMIVIPMMRDQPENALRVEQHNLGRSVNIDSLSTKILEEAILDVLTDEDIKNSIEKMMSVFRQKEQQKLGSQMIKEQLR